MRGGHNQGAEMVSIIVPLVMMSALLLVVVSLPCSQCASYKTGPKNPCDLSDTEPNLSDLLKQVKNFASANNTALANMIGYLKFPGKGYMPMVLTKLVVDDKKATLVSECATLTWNYELESKGSKVHLEDLELDVPTQDVTTSVDSFNEPCMLNRWQYSFPPSTRFSCKTKIDGNCRRGEAGSKYSVDVVLGSLELELAGDPSKISKGEFSSTKAAYESCEIFDN